MLQKGADGQSVSLRWLSARQWDSPEVFSAFGLVSAQLALLLITLKLNQRLEHFHPNLWVFVPLFIACSLARTRYGSDEKLVITLWQLIGLLSAVYSLLHYPLIPLVHDGLSGVSLYYLLLSFWFLSVIAGVLCFWIPSLSVLPPCFLFWSNSAALVVTGLPIATDIDIRPLVEVSICIGFGLLIHKACRRARTLSVDQDCANNGDFFCNILLMLAIAIHMGNYFWSFVAKMNLDGPFGAWLTHNNPTYIFLAALDDGHIFFSGYPRLVELTAYLLDRVHLFSNLCVLLVQGAAILVFFIPKRAVVGLLILFDLMHASIIVIAGANFWPWIMLNLVVAAIVAAAPDFRRQPLIMRVIATLFIVLSPYFVEVQRLGWYDTGANNKIYFVAVDRVGNEYNVPTNFFTFYSYSFGHMEYGSPDSKTAFDVAMNGGAYEYKKLQAGRRCDYRALIQPDAALPFDPQTLVAFIRGYHRLILMIYSTIGFFPYDLYPHHFYVPFSESKEFSKLDKRNIVAYLYRRESACLSLDSGVPQRKVITAAEFRIDVTPSSQTQP